MHVADEVEGTVQLGAVVPRAFPDDLDGSQVVGIRQHVHPPEALLAQAPQRPLQVAVLAPDDVAAEVTVGTGRGALDRYRLGHVEHDGVDQRVVAAGQGHERGAGLGLDVGGVHDGEQATTQPGAGQVVQHLEGVGRGRLVVLVVGDQGAAEVARDHLGGLEVLSREGRLPAAGHADEHHEPTDGEPEAAPAVVVRQHG